MDGKDIKPATVRDTLDMALRCKDEIVALRKQVAELAPKAHAYDTLCTVLGLLPRQGGGKSEDLVWRLDKRIKELQELMTPKPPASHPEPPSYRCPVEGCGRKEGVAYDTQCNRTNCPHVEDMRA